LRYGALVKESVVSCQLPL